MKKAGKIKAGRRRGFTLVEALTTVAVVGIIMPVAMYGISLSANMASLVKQKAAATEIAQEQLSEYVASGDWQLGSTESGDEEHDGQPKFHWTAEVADWEDNTQVPLSEVRVTVTWENRMQERSVVVSTLMYDSEAIDPTATTTGTTGTTTGGTTP